MVLALWRTEGQSFSFLAPKPQGEYVHCLPFLFFILIQLRMRVQKTASCRCMFRITHHGTKVHVDPI